MDGNGPWTPQHEGNAWRNRLKFSSLLYGLVARRRQDDLGGLASDTLSRRPSLLLLNSIYDWGSSIVPLRKQGWRFIYRRDFHFAAGERDTEAYPVKGWDPEDRVLRNNLKVLGVDLAPLLLPRLAWIWSQAGTLHVQGLHMRAFIKRNKVKGILSGTLQRGITRIICQAARDMGVPVLLWQHGAVRAQKKLFPIE